MNRKGYLFIDNISSRDYSTLLSLISSNKGDYDVCGLAWDVCTGNLDDDYLDESVRDRLLRLQHASTGAFEDFKEVIHRITKKYISHGKISENTLVSLDDKGRATFVSNKFDASFIFDEIKNFYYRGGNNIA